MINKFQFRREQKISVFLIVEQKLCDFNIRHIFQKREYQKKILGRYQNMCYLVAKHIAINEQVRDFA